MEPMTWCQHGFAVAQDAAFGPAHAVLGDARLFVEDADGAAVGGPGVRVAGIPFLVPFAVCNRRSPAGRRPRAWSRANSAPQRSPAGGDVRVDRLARRREQVRVLGAHAVRVHEQHADSSGRPRACARAFPGGRRRSSRGSGRTGSDCPGRAASSRRAPAIGHPRSGRRPGARRSS